MTLNFSLVSVCFDHWAMVTSTKCSSRCTGDMAIGIQGDDTAGSKIKYKNQRKTQDFLTSRDKYRCLSTSRSMIRPMNLQSFGEAEPLAS